MNITSVGGQELYNILFGRDVGNKVKLVPIDENNQRIENDGKRQYDRFELEKVDNNPCTSSISSLFQTGNGLYAYSFRINFFKTDDEFARHYGEIGRRLDTAYAEGKFTEDEYNELNASLAEYIGEMKTKNDYRRGEFELAKSGYRFEPPKTTGNPEEDKIITDNFLIEKQAAIDSILNSKGLFTEFAKIMEMINQYRYGSASNIVNVMLGNNS